MSACLNAHVTYLQTSLEQQRSDYEQGMAAQNKEVKALQFELEQREAAGKQLQKTADALTKQKQELGLRFSTTSDKAKELTVQLQQAKDADSELKSQLKKQTAELGLAHKQASNLERNKRELQQKLDTVLVDQKQMQSSLEGEKAAAEKLSTALKAELHQLQVITSTFLGLICTW